ncbi:hypothetical protein ACIOMM_35710 [Streptomyces sp. NPDC087908]|uniref:hypothetical protein n=1 Tax=Streptomyces sp. NPDC087908 TaxID=3365820 RepID=UPI0037F7EB2B
MPGIQPRPVDQDALQGADAPYPALVSLGWDGSGRLVLVGLEHVGVLHLDGDPDHARHVLQAIAVELASTPLPGHLEITALADTAAGLDHAAPERVARTNTLADAVAELSSHTAEQRRTLTALGATTLRAARLQEDAVDSWTPHILLAGELPDGEQTKTLLDLFGALPRVASAIVTASEHADLTLEEGWTLHCAGSDETIVLPDCGLPIKLQGLTDPHFADAIELLTLPAADTDVPARNDWLDSLLEQEEETEAAAEDEPEQDQASPGGANSPIPHTVVDGDGEAPKPAGGEDEDGMPAEYADIERQELKYPYTDYTVRPRETETTPTPSTSSPSQPPLTPMPAPSEAATEPSTPAAQHETEPQPAAASATHTPVDLPKVPAQLPPDLVHKRAEGDEAEAAPGVLLLGPVTIRQAAGRIDSNRLSAAVELTSYLALHPGLDHPHAIDDALWPGRLVNKTMRNSVISRTRSWLGKNAGGDAYFPRVQDTGDNRYRLSPAVTCDWHQFQTFARTGLARYDEDGDLALRRALALVRGRPFAALDPQRYTWAEPAVQEMVSAIADVAFELSTRRREAADHPGALWAAHQGLLAAEENEMLHRQVFLAHHAAGGVDALRAAAERLAKINEGSAGEWTWRPRPHNC